MKRNRVFVRHVILVRLVTQLLQRRKIAQQLPPHRKNASDITAVQIRIRRPVRLKEGIVIRVLPHQLVLVTVHQHGLGMQIEIAGNILLCLPGQAPVVRHEQNDIVPLHARKKPFLHQVANLGIHAHVNLRALRDLLDIRQLLVVRLLARVLPIGVRNHARLQHPVILF